MNNQQAAGVQMTLHAFAQGATHEIANPLSSISMGAEVARLMLDRGQIENVRELLERIVTDCNRCALLMQGLQRFGAGLSPREREHVGVGDFVDATVAAFHTEHRGPSPRIRSGELAAATLHIDRATLAQACADLIENATDAGATEVEIVATRDGEALCLIVRDDGQGMSADVLARAFEPFFSTRRAHGRSGLGLTLLFALAAEHGGELRLCANQPRGAVAELRLPCAPAA